MKEQSIDLFNLLPGGDSFFRGSIHGDEDLSFRSADLSAAGDLIRGEFELGLGDATIRFGMLGSDTYLVDWSSYDIPRGLRIDASFENPVLGLAFQMEGFAHSLQNPLGLDFEMRPGEANLMYSPPMEGRFEVNATLHGSTFEIMLSQVYFTGLAERYPHLFGPFLEKMLRDEPFWLSPNHLRITPAMLGAIQRIRMGTFEHAAGSLFLEAQILELLALQFDQVGRSASHGSASLSPSDIDLIHQAREILLARLTNPPSLAELARTVGTNEHKLNRGFNTLFGNSPYTLLLEHKLELARSYVLDTDLTIAEIAYRVGYRDPAHLTNSFRKKYGYPPSNLRRSSRPPGRDGV